MSLPTPAIANLCGWEAQFLHAEAGTAAGTGESGTISGAGGAPSGAVYITHYTGWNQGGSQSPQRSPLAVTGGADMSLHLFIYALQVTGIHALDRWVRCLTLNSALSGGLVRASLAWKITGGADLHFAWLNASDAVVCSVNMGTQTLSPGNGLIAHINRTNGDYRLLAHGSGSSVAGGGYSYVGGFIGGFSDAGVQYMRYAQALGQGAVGTVGAVWAETFLTGTAPANEDPPWSMAAEARHEDVIIENGVPTQETRRGIVLASPNADVGGTANQWQAKGGAADSGTYTEWDDVANDGGAGDDATWNEETTTAQTQRSHILDRASLDSVNGPVQQVGPGGYKTWLSRTVALRVRNKAITGSPGMNAQLVINGSTQAGLILGVLNAWVSNNAPFVSQTFIRNHTSGSFDDIEAGVITTTTGSAIRAVTAIWPMVMWESAPRNDMVM